MKIFPYKLFLECMCVCGDEQNANIRRHALKIHMWNLKFLTQINLYFSKQFLAINIPSNLDKLSAVLSDRFQITYETKFLFL